MDLTADNMGGGNAQKTAMARAKKLEKDQKAGKGSQLKDNAAAQSIKCVVCLQTFVCTATEAMLKQHWENRHPKVEITACFPHLVKQPA